VNGKRKIFLILGTSRSYIIIQSFHKNEMVMNFVLTLKWCLLDLT